MLCAVYTLLLSEHSRPEVSIREISAYAKAIHKNPAPG
jgi:hypothetical protein